MGLKAGRLRHRIVIQQNVPVQDPETGEMLNVWQTVPGCNSVPCAIEPLSVREFIAAQAIQSKVTTKITIRYREGMSSAFRLLHESKNVYYEVSGFLPDAKSGLEYMTAVCTDGVRITQ